MTRRIATPVTALLLTFVTPLLVPILLLGLSTGNANALTSGLLPGGTPISVDNTSPANGSEFVVSGTTLDVTDGGQAKIGAGVPITLVYTLDTSGSMTLSAGVNCDGVAGNDTRLVCAQQASRPQMQPRPTRFRRSSLPGWLHLPTAARRTTSISSLGACSCSLTPPSTATATAIRTSKTPRSP